MYLWTKDSIPVTVGEKLKLTEKPVRPQYRLIDGTGKATLPEPAPKPDISGKQKYTIAQMMLMGWIRKGEPPQPRQAAEPAGLENRLMILEKLIADQAILDNKTKSIDVPGGKVSTMYKYRGTFTLPNGQPKEITGKTASEFLQKASDATAWFYENGSVPRQPEPEPEKHGPTFREWTESLIEKHTLKSFERHPDTGYLDNWIYPFFGDRTITDIKHTDCQAFADYLAKTPSSKTGKPVCQKTASQILGLFKAIMERAVLDEIVDKNPANKTANRCKKAPKKFRCLSDDEKRIFLKTLPKITEKNVQLYAAISFSTGLRPEEIMALKWTDYHTDGAVAYFDISKAIQSQNLPAGQATLVKETKTEAGNRLVPVMCRQVLPYLNAARKQNGYIVTGLKKNRDGAEPISAHQKSTIDDKMNHYLQAEGMKKRTTGYDCRHTIATILHNIGAVKKSVTEIVGHTDVDFTIDTYISKDWNQIQKDAQKVVSYIDELIVA